MLFRGSSASTADVASGEKRTTGTTTTTSKKDPERFYCPFEGCNRSFAELWRLKVHYRAAPDVRGSGKERGHGAELESCPKCGAELKPGRHHVGCAAGRQTAAQQERRRTLKGRKRAGCKSSTVARTTPSDTSAQLVDSGKHTTAVGVPVSWMPLDFDQFFLPIQRMQQGMERPELMPDTDSVYSLVYGNQGELPTMAMAQVGMDLDSEMDFSQFFSGSNNLDPSFGLSTSIIKEEWPPITERGTDLYFSNETDPFSDELDKFLTELKVAEEEGVEDMSDITGKKRERRSSLEQRMEKRNGKDEHKCRSIPKPVSPEMQPVYEINEQIPGTTVPHLTSHFLNDALSIPECDRVVDESVLTPMETAGYGTSVLPRSVERRSEMGMLVKGMIGCDLHRNDKQISEQDTGSDRN